MVSQLIHGYELPRWILVIVFAEGAVDAYLASDFSPDFLSREDKSISVVFNLGAPVALRERVGRIIRNQDSR